MSKYIIELEDNDDGVKIKSHTLHTTEQINSGQVVTLTTQLGDCLVEHLARRMTAAGLSAPTQSLTQH